jgi:TolA-binding protein
MRKVLVMIAILAVAAACGASEAAPALSQSGAAPVPNQQTGKGSTVPGSTDFGPNQPSTVPVQGPQVIKQAQLTLTVKSGTFDSSLAAVRGLVEGEQGFIAGTDAQANPESNDQIRSGVISFMVPAGNFDATIDALNNLGKVQSEHITGQDVSSQYVDLRARLANEEAQRDAMLALLAQAHNINDIITVQNQLGQITQQIEQLKGQIQYLDHNTTFSTIAVTIVEAGAPVQTTTGDSWGFATALSAAAHNFVTTINYVVSGLGAIGPVLILLGLGYLVWRRRGSPGLKRT